MPISLSFRNPVQVILLAGTLSLAEDAALRLKLSEKINQGRRFILFQLEKFALDDEGSRLRLLSLASYCLENKVFVAFCGAPQNKWPLLVGPDQKQLEKFVSEAEAFAWFETAALEKPADAKSAGADLEEQIKQGEIQELLKRYEPFQNLNEFDPYHLKSLLQIYRKSPNRETIVELERAMRDLRKHQERVAALQIENEQAARELLDLTKYRKMPMTPAEIAARQNEMQASQKTLLHEAQRLTTQLRELEEQAKAFDLKSENLQFEKARQIKEWRDKISEQQARNELLREKLAAASAQEDAQLKRLQT